MQSLISPWKRMGKKITTQGIRHLSKYEPRRTGLNFVERAKHVAVLVV